MSIGIADSVMISIKKFEILMDSVPSKKVSIVGFVTIFLIFILGVILPMLLNKISKIFMIWVPSIFYMVAYGYLIYFASIRVAQI